MTGRAASRDRPVAAREGADREQILIVLHQENSTPGRVGLNLKHRGFGLDIRRPALGDPLPETLAGHRGVVIFGGPMSVNDDVEFIHREREWIAVPLKEDKPLLGICLGAQLIADHIGGTVGPAPGGVVEIGYYPIEPTAAGRAMMEWPAHVHQWHREWLTPPGHVEVLAVGPNGSTQAFRAGPRAYGVQFHPELTLAMVHRWTVRGADRFHLEGAQERNRHFEGRMRHDRAVRQWLDRFLDMWLA